jgi:hypothetical protein
MQSGIPNSPDERPAPVGRGFDGAIKTLTWDTVRGPGGAAALLSAAAFAGIAAKRARRDTRRAPQTISCAIAGDWVLGPEPDPTPSTELTREQLDLTEDRLNDALNDDRDAARAAARRARNLDSARQHGERAVMMSETGTDPGPNFLNWSKSDIAYREFVPQVACKLRISEKAAEDLVTTARSLVQDLPDTLALLEAGETTYRHAESMVRHSYALSTEHLAQYEEILIPFAKTLTPAAFDNKARQVADSFKDDPLEERHEEAMKRRHVKVVPADDGMAEVCIYTDAVDAQAIRNRLTKIGRELQNPDDGRTLTQTTTDAATELLLYGITEYAETEGAAHGFDPTAVGMRKSDQKGRRKRGLGVGIHATVSIHVPVLSILGHGDEPVTLEGYGPISKDRARELMGRNATSFTRILTDPETGAILSVGGKKYKVPAEMRMFLLTRDVRCRFPGCNTPARFCEMDHTEDWQYGGPTDVLNLASLCKRHHALKHNTGWTYTQDQFGVLTWVSPTGATYVTEPENWVQGKPIAQSDEIVHGVHTINGSEVEEEEVELEGTEDENGVDVTADEAAVAELHRTHPNMAGIPIRIMHWPSTHEDPGTQEQAGPPRGYQPPDGLPF